MKNAFRKAYGELSSLRSFLKPGTPMLALTATVEQRNREALTKLLGMNSLEIIDVSINNENIRFSVQAVKKGLGCLNWLVEEISVNQDATPKSIIFCRSINDVSLVLSYLLKKLGHLAYMDNKKSPINSILGVYHSNSPTELKERVTKSLKNNEGPVRVVIATSALSLGVNFKDIRYVIHYGPAQDLRSHLQEAGRAGRDGKEAHNIVYFHGQQLRLCDKKIKECLKVDTCIRVALFKDFDSTIKPLKEGHSCCCNCHKMCKCGGESCLVDVPLFDNSTAEIQGSQTGKQRNLNEEDKTDLQLALHEIQETLNGDIPFPVLGNRVMAHGFSEDVIKGVVDDAGHIFDVEYLIEHHHIASMQLARDIIEIFSELFEDIDISCDPLFSQSPALEQNITAVTSGVNMDDLLFCDYFDSSSESEQEDAFPMSDDFDDLFATITL